KPLRSSRSLALSARNWSRSACKRATCAVSLLSWSCQSSDVAGFAGLGKTAGGGFGGWGGPQVCCGTAPPPGRRGAVGVGGGPGGRGGGGGGHGRRGRDGSLQFGDTRRKVGQTEGHDFDVPIGVTTLEVLESGLGFVVFGQGLAEVIVGFKSVAVLDQGKDAK